MGAAVELGVWLLDFRHIAPAAASMMRANVPISALPLTACPSEVPAITPGIAAAVNAAACRQQTLPWRA